MRKVSILKRKIIHAYNNPRNWEFSKFKGYPEDTYFGYDSLEQMIKVTIKDFTDYYGKGLKKWRYY